MVSPVLELFELCNALHGDIHGAIPKDKVKQRPAKSHAIRLRLRPRCPTATLGCKNATFFGKKNLFPVVVFPHAVGSRGLRSAATRIFAPPSQLHLTSRKVDIGFRWSRIDR